MWNKRERKKRENVLVLVSYLICGYDCGKHNLLTKYLNIRPETIKLLEGNRRKTLDIGLGSNSFGHDTNRTNNKSKGRTTN